MIILTGGSLNQRHRELNTKVNEAAKNKLSFEEVKNQSEKSDVDKLFKIDLASKYKDINYILEVIKSSDSLHTSRALKCDWIGDDEFSQYINPQYLDKNIFPFMSPKMKKKFLATLTARIRNGDRAEVFHHYCMSNRLHKFGMGFLLYTNESFKIEILTQHPHVYKDFDRTEEYLGYFIGNSFVLAEYYLKAVRELARPKALYKLRYMYWVSQDKYLDLLETFHSTENECLTFYNTSNRLSISIMKNHKNRVLQNPRLYINTLHSELVVKYSTCDDAKVYAIAVLPQKCCKFWQSNFYESNEYFLRLIPLGERFCFIKKIFTEKYPGEMFEESYKFYTNSFYDMMTVEEKQDWALRHVASERELHGCGNDYIWYKFINFELAFIELKKYILIAPDDSKRTNILKTLIDSAETEEEVTTLLEYFYNKHINELKETKRMFLNKLVEKHKVLYFNNDCWAALEKIFYSLEVFNKLSEDNSDYENNKYRIISLVYYIIHKKPVPEVFYDFITTRKITSDSIKWKLDKDFDTEKRNAIFQYLLQCMTTHVNTLIEVETKDEKLTWITYILDLIVDFDKTLDDIPKVVYEHIMLHFEDFKYHYLFAMLEKSSPSPVHSVSHIRDVMHYLKEDASLVVQNFPAIREYFQAEHQKANINWLIRKLQIYFRHDIAPVYIKLLNECLDMKDLYLQTARVAVFGILNLSEEQYKIDFLKKYVPVDAKIDHVNICRNLLTIQTAICSVACHSRPPLPLPSFREYIKGDYLQYCIPIFDSYLANLTPDQCSTFVDSILKSPLSVQKHGLRLAFHCFSTENLKTLVLKVWKKMKNVSLRKILYKALFHKITTYQDNLTAQLELFEALIIMTQDLHQDDDDEIFGLWTNADPTLGGSNHRATSRYIALSRRRRHRPYYGKMSRRYRGVIVRNSLEDHYHPMQPKGLPPKLFGQLLQSGYTVVSTFPKRTINYKRLTRIVETIGYTTEHISISFLRPIMEDLINTALEPNLILNKELTDGHYKLLTAKWKLIQTVIIKHKDMHILNIVVDNMLKKWYETEGNKYIYRKFWSEFIQDLERLSYEEHPDNYLLTNNVFEVILRALQNALPFKQIFITFWQFKTSILTKQVLGESIHDIAKMSHDKAFTEFLVKDAILKYSKRIGDFIKECIEEKKYFPFFYQDIQDIINEFINYFAGVLNCHSSTDVTVTVNDVLVLFCSVLSEYDIREMTQFVLNFLPTDNIRHHYFDEYSTVINKLKCSDDEETQYFMCNKFYCSDYLYRNFLS